MELQVQNSALEQECTVDVDTKGRPVEKRSAPLSLAKLFGRPYLTMALAGALLGFSCPGFEQHYLVWFGLVPLFLTIFAPISKKQAFIRALIFGTAYNLVYLHWLVFTHPLTWTGFARQIPHAFALGAWLIFSLQQGFIIALFALASRFVPMRSGFLPVFAKDPSPVKIFFPSFLVLPFLWVLIVNRLGNAHLILGVPWAMLEYSQYKQLELLALTPYIGGIGIGALIVLVNCALTSVVQRVFSSHRVSLEEPRLNAFSFASRKRLLLSCVMTFGGLLSAALAGEWLLLQERVSLKGLPVRPITVIQGNGCPGISGEAPEKVVDGFVKMTIRAPKNLCLWTEWSVPASIVHRGDVFKGLAEVAARQGQEWIIGCYDETEGGQYFNSAALLSGGAIKGEIYSKRYLVPFGEYVPAPLHLPPFCYLFCTGTPEKSDFASGQKPVVMPVADYEVSPIICFESIAPELVSQSVRAGGQVIVNLSNTIWFRDSIMSDQMIAFAAFRAAECKRSFVFSTNVGPSVFIDPLGQVTKTAPRGKAIVMSADVPLCREMTPFCRFYR